MPEDNKPLSKPFKLQLQFCCRMALISHDMAGSEPLPWLATGLWVSEARGHLSPLLISSCSLIMLSRAPVPTPAHWWGKLPPVWMSSRAIQDYTPFQQFLPLKPEGKILPQTPVVSPELSRTGHGYEMNEQR